jgi:uncharacterized protein (UPF0332 family)
LLFSENILAKTHQSVQVKFSEIFVKTHIFTTEYNTIFKQLAELREISDYDLDAEIDEKDCIFAVQSAQKFLNRTKQYLEEKT